MVKKPISVALCLILALALISSAPAGLSLFLMSTKAQVASSTAGSAPTQNQQQKAPPLANAGQNQVVYQGTTVRLNASGSIDRNPGGYIAEYRWVQIAGIPVSLIGSNTAYPTFVVPAPLSPLSPPTAGPAASQNTMLIFSLTVTDNYGLTSTAPSSVAIIVLTASQNNNHYPFLGGSSRSSTSNGLYSPNPNPTSPNPNQVPPNVVSPYPPNTVPPNPYNYPYQYQYPHSPYAPPNNNGAPNHLYQYPPYPVIPPSSNTVPPNPFALKQGNASTFGSIPNNNKVTPRTTGGGIITNTNTSSPFSSSVKSASSHPVINNTTNSANNATSGISGTIKPSQTSAAASLSPAVHNNLTNAIQHPSKINQVNPPKSQNQTNAKVKPRALALAPPAPPACTSVGTAPATVSVGSGPSRVAFNPVNCDIYVTNGGTISVIDGTSNLVIETLTLPNNNVPRGGITVDPTTGNVFVGADNFTDSGPQSSVFMISSLNIINNTAIGVASDIQDVAFDPTHMLVYTASDNSALGHDIVNVINPHTGNVVNTFDLTGAAARGIAFDLVGNAYVTEGPPAQISVISGLDTVSTIDLHSNSNPRGIAFDPNNHHLYVAEPFANNVVSVDPAHSGALANISLGASKPERVVFDSTDGNIYVSDTVGSGSVIPIEGTNVLTPIPVGQIPTGIGFDSANGELFVANSGSENSGTTVSVIKPSASPPPPTAPVVTSTIPADKTTGIPITTSVTATFNEPLKNSTVNTSTFTLSQATPPCIEGCGVTGTVSLSSDGMTATFKPTGSLFPSTNYTATIGTGVQSSSGINMASPKSWSFITGAVSIAPTIKITSVSNNSPRWGIDPVSVSGSTTGATPGDTVTMNWADGTTQSPDQTRNIPINAGGNWGPVSHTYNASATSTNPNNIVAQLLSTDSAAIADTSGTCSANTSPSCAITVQPHKTSLVLNPVRSITAGTTVDAIGNLTDKDLPSSSSSVTAAQLVGKRITFSCGPGCPSGGDGSTIFTSVEPNNGAPVRTGGVNFTDPVSGHVNIRSCSNCVVSSSVQGGITGNTNVMHLHAGSTINFPPGITQVVLRVQDMGTSSYTFNFTTSDGVLHTGHGSFTPNSGIIPELKFPGGTQADGVTPIDVKQIGITSVSDSSGSIPNTMGISKMLLENHIYDQGKDIQTINFDSLTAGSTAYTATKANPFVLDGGLYFSIGTSQTTPQNNPPFQVQAHFAGNMAYLSSDSAVQTYITNPRTANGGAGDSIPVSYTGKVYSTFTCTLNSDHDGICDTWKKPGTYPAGPTPTGCPATDSCIPFTTTTSPAKTLYYDLCITDQFSDVFGGAKNAHVCPTLGHKDIFVQLSWMNGYEPTDAAIKLVIKAFANAPITTNTKADAFGHTNGITLHVQRDTTAATTSQPLFNVWTDIDTELASTCGASCDDFFNVKLGHFGSAAERAIYTTGGVNYWNNGCTGPLGSGGTITVGVIQCGNEAKAQVFHYGLFVNNWGSTCTNGVGGPSGASEIIGNSLVVSLGCGFTANPGAKADNGAGLVAITTAGSDDEQAGTFMHELGHNFNLGHGGPQAVLNSDGTLNTSFQPNTADVGSANCKSNYLSVMTYSRQLPAVKFLGTGTPWETQGLDYSRVTPNTAHNILNEGALSESAGTGTAPNPPNTVIWGTSSASIHTARAGPNIDWNANGHIDTAAVNVDINNVGIVGCQTSTSTLEDASPGIGAYDDWDNLWYNFRTGTNYLNGVFPDVSTNPDMTGQMYQTLKNEVFTSQGFTLLFPRQDGNCFGQCVVGNKIPIAFRLVESNPGTAKVTFTAQQINPTTGTTIGNPFIATTTFQYIKAFGCNCYGYLWNTAGLNSGTWAIKLYKDYNLPTQQLLVGQGQNDITVKVVLQPRNQEH